MVRHKKRGTEYRVIGKAQLQATQPLPDDTVLVVYVGDDRRVWAREEAEFEDGRFEDVPTTRAPSPPLSGLQLICILTVIEILIAMFTNSWIWVFR